MHTSATRGSWVGLGMALALVLLFACLARPDPVPGFLPGSDAQEYVHLAVALEHGTHLVDYDGPPRPTRYTPGFSVLLIPALALGGFESAVWVSYLAALVLGGLAALLAWRIGGGLAAPIAVILALYTIGMYITAHIIMSDLPSAAIALAELGLVAVGVGRPSAALAGLLGGVLVWIRPGSLVLVAAGIAGLSATPVWKRRIAWYVVGLVPLLLCLGWWQWAAFGSPFVTSYQATRVSPGASAEITSFFSWQYVFGPPWNTYSVGTEPNALVYLRALVGIDNDTTYPGVGLIGIVGAVVLARGAGAAAVIGRFTLAASTATLLLYVPYFYRDLRFIMLPTVLNDIIAAVMISTAVSALRRALPIARSYAQGDEVKATGGPVKSMR